MCMAMEKIKSEGIAEGRREGKREGLLAAAKRMLEKGRATVEELVDDLRLTKAQERALRAML